MTFSFKQKSHDFFVSENLPYKLSGKWDAFYVYFEKRNVETQEVIKHLRDRFKISRLTLGIAGLKDKKAVAKQWISIYDRALKRLGGERVFVEALEEIVQVIETGRHQFPMNMSTPITNSFHIRLRAEKKLGQLERDEAFEIVKDILHAGYANLFGAQRFGINGRNSTQGWEIMTGTGKEKFQGGEKIFKLQAYSSKLFNEYVEARIRAKKMLVDGDLLSWKHKGKVVYGFFNAESKKVDECFIRQNTKWAKVIGKQTFFFTPEKTGNNLPYDSDLMHVTGPVPWYNGALCHPSTEAGKLEAEFLNRAGATEEAMWVFKEEKVFGLRRQMWVKPSKTNVRYQHDDMLIDFTLPAGSYASIVVDDLMKKLK